MSEYNFIIIIIILLLLRFCKYYIIFKAQFKCRYLYLTKFKLRNEITNCALLLGKYAAA